MSLGKTEVEYISRLTQIDVQENQIESVAKKLSNILELFAQMEAVDTEEVAPMAHPLDAVQRLRPDAVTEVDQHERLQAIAPAVAEAYYLVPQVIE